MSKSTPVPEGQLEIELFKGNEIRKILHENEWFFSVIDVVGAVTGTKRPRKYWSDLKSELIKEGYTQLSDIIGQLKMPGIDGKERLTDTANTETMFRIIQSIRSKKAEPFKRWLAKVGYERILESQNPEVAIKRALLDYKIQGRSDDWINARVKSILERNELTREWKARGIEEGKQYAILTNLIQKGTFGLDARQHKSLKGLKSQNLRDHMTSGELIFMMLGEQSTKEIAVAEDARGFVQNKYAAKAGGKVAGDARKALEKLTGQKVVSSDNFLPDNRKPQPKLSKPPSN